MDIGYLVCECENVMGRTLQKELKTFDNVNDAIKYHSELKDGEYIFYQIIVEYITQ